MFIAKLKIIYFAHVQSIISYGIIFWGSSPGASKIFRLQKKTLRIIYNMRPRDSCRELFNQKQIMTVFSLYLYLLAYLQLIINIYLNITMTFTSITPEIIPIYIFPQYIQLSTAKAHTSLVLECLITSHKNLKHWRRIPTNSKPQ